MKNKRMKTVKRSDNKKYAVISKYIIKCLLPGFAVTAVCIALLTYLYCRDSGNKLLYYAVYAAIGSGAFATGFAAFATLKGRGILTGALGGLPFALILITLSLIILKGEVSLFILVIIPVSVILSSVGGIVSANWSAKI